MSKLLPRKLHEIIAMTLPLGLNLACKLQKFWKSSDL